LPVRDPEREPVPVPPFASERALLLGGYTIVAVDDDEDTRELLKSVLENAGARVCAAASADQAIAVCRAERPHAIVSDIGMPLRDGYSLIQELRESPGPEAPAVSVALSAYASAADRERALAAGFDAHVAKPFDAAHLVKTLHDLLEEAESGRDRRNS
jgi:CheY-like chemotaxis protein